MHAATVVLRVLPFPILKVMCTHFVESTSMHEEAGKSPILPTNFWSFLYLLTNGEFYKEACGSHWLPQRWGLGRKGELLFNEPFSCIWDFIPCSRLEKTKLSPNSQTGKKKQTKTKPKPKQPPAPSCIQHMLATIYHLLFFKELECGIANKWQNHNKVFEKFRIKKKVMAAGILCQVSLFGLGVAQAPRVLSASWRFECAARFTNIWSGGR